MFAPCRSSKLWTARPFAPGLANAALHRHGPRIGALRPSLENVFRVGDAKTNSPRAPMSLRQRRNGPGRLVRDRSFSLADLLKARHDSLELDLRAGLFEGGLDLLGFFLANAFFDGLGSAFDQVLGFFQAKSGDRADFLDDFDLLVA